MNIKKYYKKINDWCYENPTKGYLFIVIPAGTLIVIPVIYLMAKIIN